MITKFSINCIARVVASLPVACLVCLVALTSATTASAADTTNIFTSVLTNLVDYVVNGSAPANRRFDIWNSSRITVSNTQTVGSNAFGSLTLNSSTNLITSTCTVGLNPGVTGLINLTGGSLLDFQGTDSNAVLLLSIGGIGKLTASNSTVRAFSMIMGDTNVAQPSLTLVASTNVIKDGPASVPIHLSIASVEGVTATVNLSQGSFLSVQTNSMLLVGDSGFGTLTASNSTIEAFSQFIGYASESRGTMTMVASTNFVLSSSVIDGQLGVGNSFIGENTGVVTMVNGSLCQGQENATLKIGGLFGVGTLSATNSTLTGFTEVVVGVFFEGVGTMTLVGSTNVVLDTMILCMDAETTGTVSLAQGSLLIVTNGTHTGNIQIAPFEDPMSKGTLSMANSTAWADSVLIGPPGNLLFTSTNQFTGIINNLGILTSSSGIQTLTGSLILQSGSTTTVTSSQIQLNGTNPSLELQTDAMLSVPANGIVRNAGHMFISTSSNLFSFPGRLNFNGDGTLTQTLQVGGIEKGSSMVNYTANFGLGILEVGIPSALPTRLSLVGGITNAQYAGQAVVDAGAILDLNGVPLHTSNTLNQGELWLNGSTFSTTVAFTNNGVLRLRGLDNPASNVVSVISGKTINNGIILVDGGRLTLGSITNNGLIMVTNNSALILQGSVSGSGTLNAPPPLANFTGSPRTGGAPFLVTFTDVSSGVLTNFFWSFGDGSTSNTTATVMTHTYSVAGSKTVTLIASGPGGVNTNTRLDYIVVTNHPAPVANFTGTPTNGPAPLTVTFTDSSTGTITNRNWTFGDGSSTNTTVTNMVHTYNVGGTNTVRLIASGFSGVSTNNRVNYIRVTNIPPVAIFSGSPTNGLVPLTVTFTDVSTGTITNRNWSFGDGSSTNTTSTNMVHTYNGTGTNTVRLIARGPVGVSTNTRNNYIIVKNPPPPVANFVGIPTQGAAPLTVTFSDTSTGSITNRFWQFGDGGTFNTASTTNVPYTYTSAGTYTVRLAVSGTTGSSTKTNVNYIVVSNAPPPVASFTGTPTNGAAPLAVMFNDTSTGGITIRKWTFGDGSTLNTTATNVVHVYSLGGTNTVRLIAEGPSGVSTNTRVNYIRVTNQPPAAAFSGSPTNGLAPLTVTFIDTSTGTITNRNWSFGDGSSTNTTSTNIVHVYTTAGIDTVRLIAKGPSGTSTNTRNNYIVVTNIPPILVVTPSTRNYGSVTIGQTSNQVFSVINSGQLTLTGTATVAGPFAVSSGSPYIVPPKQTNSVTVTFAPVTAGGFSTNIIFNSNGGVSSNIVIGTGLTPSQIGVSPANLQLGTILTGLTSQASFIVTNRGGTALTGSAVLSNATFAILSGSPYTLDGFGSTNVVVRFTPATEGVFTTNVVFTSNDGTVTNTVTGTGATVPVASFTGSPTIGLAPLLVTFTDTSTGTVTNRFWNFGDGATTNTVSTNVAHNYTLGGTNNVTMIASGPVGVSTNTKLNFIVVTNKPPQLSVSPVSRNFGLLAVGQTNTLPFQVANLGELTLTGTATVGGPFAISSGGSYSVAGGQTGTVNVSFIPVTAGTFGNNVVFVSNGGGSTNLVFGNGDFAPVAIFSANPTNGIAPLAVTFDDSSTGTITNRFWNFGDGVTLNTTSTNVAHTYGVAGTNTVTLIASGPVGVSTNSKSGLVAVLVYPPGDVNGTFTVTTGDSLLINQVEAGLKTTNGAGFAGSGFANGDANRDGVVDTGDSLLINQCAVNLRSYVVTKVLPDRRTNNVPTTVTIYGISFPTNTVTSVTIGPPVNLALTYIVVLNAEQIRALVPAGGGLGTGTVNVVATPTNGVLLKGTFINQ